MSVSDHPVLILGAGINGAALARELALNRVPVCVVDTGDLASGTTAYSSRLIHGGLRYLEYGEFDLVRESLAERTRWLRLAPQFVRPLRLFIPVRKRWGGLWDAAARFLGWKKSGDAESAPQPQRGLWTVRIGLSMYDRFARDPMSPGHRVHRVGADGPSVDRAQFRWLCEFMDAQIMYPERFVVALLNDARQIAVEQGVSFDLFTYHRATLTDKTVAIYPIGDDGRVAQSFEPAAVVNATGAWVDETLSALHIPSKPLIGGTKGSHFLTANETLRGLLAGRAIYGEARDGRPVFILPFGASTLVGTTDEPYRGHPQDAQATNVELDYLLDAVNHILPDAQLAPVDIEQHYCGVRPLPKTDAATPAAITRRHWLEENTSSAVPMYSVIGGKLTTCRSLAEEAVATILPRIGRNKIADSRERPLSGTEVEAVLHRGKHPHPGHLPKGEEDFVTRTAFPRDLVRRVIQTQWVRTLDDLVERRLMLLYHPRLETATLRDLAQLLVEAKLLATDRSESEVAAVTAQLKNRYGKQVVP
jgi:glycerol-3-phosphate dehydrogenase